MIYVELFLIGISLSIDAFSLALSIGLNNILKKEIRMYSVFVGIFHFFMPILGSLIRVIVGKMINLPNKEIFILVLIFLIIGILVNKNDTQKIVNPLFFSFSVSLDSFIIGFSLPRLYVLTGALIFCIISALFTYIGFISANKIRNLFKAKSKTISLFILVFILIYNIFSYVKA